MFELEEIRTQAANIKVVGVGGAGGNVINNMMASNIKTVQFIAINTDAQDLEASIAPKKVQIGNSVTRGLGAGSKPEIGRQSALEDRTLIAEALEGADMVFVTAGMGGGTGTGASPIVAGIAKEMGALTVAIVTKPFYYEGKRRMLNAEEGLKELEKNVDTLIVIPNDRISLVIDKITPMLESFSIANNVLKHAVQGMADMILIPGLINLDFADVKTVMERAGRAVMGMGIGKGESRAIEATKKAISNPLLENSSIDGAKGILINVTGGLDLTLNDLEQAAALIHESADKQAIILIGSAIATDLMDEVRVTVIATGFVRNTEAKTAEPVPRTIQLPYSTEKWMMPQLNLRGSERLLAKTLINMSYEMPADGMEEPLDIPTFLRKAPHKEAGL